MAVSTTARPPLTHDGWDAWFADAPWLNRPPHELFALEDTPESFIAGYGIPDLPTLSAVMGRPNKSALLLTTVLGALSDGVPERGGAPGRRRYLLMDASSALAYLRAEPALNAGHLCAMAAVVYGPTVVAKQRDAHLVAIATHPAAGPYTLIAALWAAPAAAAMQVARVTGSFLPAAIWWVHTEVDRDSRIHECFGPATNEQSASILALAASWEQAAVGNPAMASFLTVAPFSFTHDSAAFNLGALLAAASAVCAPPARHPAPQTTKAAR